MSLHTVIGSTGVIGRNVARALPEHGVSVRLVSRSPNAVMGNEELVKADVLDAASVDRAVAGSSVVYLCVGLPYSLKVWRTQWPVVMRNVLDACAKHGSRLVFFDNIYAYGSVDGPITEDSPVRPTSEKGKVRAAIAGMLLEAIAEGRVQGLIARSADFYGPDTANSFFTALVNDRLKAGKAAQWMLDPGFRHSLTYTPDAGKATALLGNRPDALGRVWHLPTASPALTGTELIALAAKGFGVEPKVQVLGRGMLRLVGLFVPAVRENMEMLYQLDHDYLFDSGRFEQAFGMHPTSHADGMQATVAWYKNP